MTTLIALYDADTGALGPTSEQYDVLHSCSWSEGRRTAIIPLLSGRRLRTADIRAARERYGLCPDCRPQVACPAHGGTETAAE